MDELLAQFLIEGPELVQQGSDALLALERRPDDRSLTDDAFRAVHTLKGSVGLFDLPAMGAALHAAEDVLGAVRAGGRVADAATIDALLAVLSQTERWLAALEAEGALPSKAMDVAVKLATQLDVGEVVSTAPVASPAPGWAETLRGEGAELHGPLTAIRYLPASGCYFSGDDPVSLVKAIPGLMHLKIGMRPADDPEGPYDPFDCRLILEGLATAAVDEVRAVLRFVPDQVEIVALPARDRPSAGPAVETEAHGEIRTLRIDAARVEQLAAMVDELVAARTALAAVSSLAVGGGDPGAVAQRLATQSETIERLVGQLHRQVTALRMTPLAPLLRRFPRVARELASSLGKDVDLVVSDNGVEADKTIVEGLFEPLTHLLRNAVDHGLETPDVRAAAGKARKGIITLAAEAFGGRLRLTLRDDGAGVNPTSIRAAVLDRGLMAEHDLAALSDQQAVNLIFLPGFSTARSVTEVSGRGVGMDAVKTAVQRMGGRIAIDSAAGQGTAVELILPLSLTLTKIMVVASDDELYGVPMERVLETLRVPDDAVIAIRAGQAFNWRHRTVPLLPLASLVGGKGRSRSGDRKVLIIRSGVELFGIEVDAIRDRADVAVRPLDGLLAGMPGVSGSTLLGDGRVLMILDPEALVG